MKSNVAFQPMTAKEILTQSRNLLYNSGQLSADVKALGETLENILSFKPAAQTASGSETVESCQRRILQIVATFVERSRGSHIVNDSDVAREIAAMYVRMGEIYQSQNAYEQARACFYNARLLDSSARKEAQIKPAAIDKNIIMCVTTGRSGTNLLEKLLALAEDTCAFHEPDPGFHDVLQDVQSNPAAAISFVDECKLPFILSCPQKNYAETSHVFGKGFFEAFIARDIPFRTIMLNRDPRKVAMSYWRMNTVPHRTKSGREWLLQPEQRDVLPLQGWQDMSDYQLCYWYCLEVERRKALYMKQCQERGLTAIEISLDELQDWKRFQELCKACGVVLPETAETLHAAIAAEKVNAKEGFPEKLPEVPFEIQEEAVWNKIGAAGFDLRKQVKARYSYA